MTNKTFDPTKPCTTRDGRKVEILRTDMKSLRPIVAIITEASGSQWVTPYGPDGRVCPSLDNSDLINIPEKQVRWLNVYPFGSAMYVSREDADAYAQLYRIACIRIEYTEGEGLK